MLSAARVKEGDTFYVVLEGELDVVVGSEASPTRIAVLKHGDYFGEMALLQGGKRTATVMASRRARADFCSIERGV